MAYAKPIVTIELEEYSELLSLKEGLKGDDFMNMAKEVVVSLINNMMQPEKAINELRSNGIFLVLNNSQMRAGGLLTKEDITITKK